MGLPEHQLDPELILRGQLQDLDLSTLLSALRLGRQYLTLELFDSAGASQGVVSVKSGRILSALAGEERGAAAVRQLLESRDAAEFRVRMQPSDAELDQEPLGTLDGISEMARTEILQGVLTQQLTLAEVLRVVAFTRQHVSLTLADPTGQPLGEVRAKAGKVLSARAGEASELPALQELLRAPAGTRFVLFTEADSVAQLRPLGSLTELLSRPGVSAQSNGRKTLPPPLPRPSRPPATSPRRARILEGNLDEFEVAHVLEVLSTSRQHFELHVRDDATGSVGVIEVKSGIVIGASTNKLSGVTAAREILKARAGRFVALRRTEATGERAPLISVSALLRPPAASRDLDGLFEDTPTLSVTEALAEAAKTDAPADPAPIPVLDGKLGDLDVASILHVAGASRQYTCVHIFDDQKKPLGTIHLKSGHVVRAQAQDVSGVAAVRRLLHSPRDFSYLVLRYPNASEVTSSIGSISNVLERAAAQTQAQTPPTAARPSRTPTPTQLTPVPSSPRRNSGAPNSSWMGGAVLGAGFVLLGGIAAAIVLRSPALNTSVSPSTAAPPVPPPPASARAEPAREEPPEPAAPSSSSPEAATSSAPAAPSRATIASFQAGLHQLGYETGPIDGVIGPKTSAALKAFQYAEHLSVDGTLSGPTRAVLLRRINEP